MKKTWAAVVSATAAANRKVTLDCSAGGGVQLDVAAPTDFFVAVPDGNYAAGDLTITFYAGVTEIASLTNMDSALNTERSYIYEIGKDANAYESMRMILDIKNPQGGNTNYWCTFRLPFSNSTDPYSGGILPTDLIIDWGDGERTTIPKGTTLSDPLKTHRYPDDARGEYTITITSRASVEYMADATNPRIPRFSCANCNEAGRISISAFPDPPILHFQSTTGTNSFRNLQGPVTVCGKLFSKNPQLINMNNVFENTSLRNIPADLFEGLDNAEVFSNAFHQATFYYEGIPEGLFTPVKNATNFNACFSECYFFDAAIPAGLFKGLDKAVSFSNAFYNTNLKQIPADTFEGCTAAQTFASTFRDCTDLVGPIPAVLFADCTGAETFFRTFMNCPSLSGSIPAGLFKGMERSTTFESTFHGCTSLTALPLPPNWNAVTDANKAGYCYDCTAASNYADPSFEGSCRNAKL